MLEPYLGTLPIETDKSLTMMFQLKKPVILSEVGASRSEAPTQSKEPNAACTKRTHQGILPALPSALGEFPEADIID